jgi:DNA-binding response OmpR family regulator
MQQQSIPDTPCVLLIEDNEESRAMLQMMMEMQGYQAVAAEEVDHALTLMTERIPDLIIINISPPLDEGLQMLRQIHEYYSLYQVPIIATSTCSQPGFRIKALRAGSNAVFIKPIDFNQFESEIAQNLPPTSSSH